MISPADGANPPANPKVKIWRYMDLAKFVSMLFSRSLHFTRADLLGDPFEGSITKVQYDLRDHIRKHRHVDPRFVQWRKMSDDEVEKYILRDVESNRMFRAHTFVNCWHANEHESAAMWRLYSQGREAVCIQSTFERLASGLPPQTYAGLVNYIDYETGEIPVGITPLGNVVNSFLSKRLSFAHEQEIRALVYGPFGPNEPPHKPTEHGIEIEIDLVALVEAVHVSPDSQIWFKNTVDRLMAAQGLEIPIRQSSLSAAALF
jgi:hypothetical protein